MSSWFRSQEPRKVSVKEAVKVLYPRRPEPERCRFSQLLLEHGEKHLQDWAVVAQTKVDTTLPSSPNSKGKPYRRHAPSTPVTTWAQAPQKPSAAATTPRSKQQRQKKKHHKQHHRHNSSEQFQTASNIPGRLHLCSRSIVFEPDDAVNRDAVWRIPLRQWSHENDIEVLDTHTVAVRALKHWLLFPQHPQPSVSIHKPVQFQFKFLHSSPDVFLSITQQLVASANQHHSRNLQSSGSNGDLLSTILKPMLERPFDPTNLVDVRERVVTPTFFCEWITPLQKQPGCMVMTGDRLYFQPAQGFIQCKCKIFDLRDLVATAKRYSGLRDSALELFFTQGGSTNSAANCSTILLAFARKDVREQVLKALPAVRSNGQPVISHSDVNLLKQAHEEWQAGKLTNMEYLLLLNSAAGRTLQDLSRYPVFPWVLRDYESPSLDMKNPGIYRDLSKPVGALDDERLRYFETRLENMQELQEPFLYGTHYSAPGYVLFYLVRSMPEHMLCLQNGKFDAPDRMFHSISQCFKCVNSNHADVKELIPEFFYPPCADFLINARNLQLGATQNGDRVNDVALPPWASSAKDFLKKNAQALEAEHVTARLPLWIDLIFGYQSRGPAALEARNLFHPMAYTTSVALAAMQPEERVQAELHATEFGIVPDQLFQLPHPPRSGNVTDTEFILKRLPTSEEKGEAWELLDPPEPACGDPALASKAEDIVETPVNASTRETKPVSLAKMENVSAGQSPVDLKANSINDSERDLPLSGSGERKGNAAFASGFSGSSNNNSSDTSATADQPVLLANDSLPQPLEETPSSMANWDMKIIDRKRLHGDTISACHILEDNKRTILATTSLDGGLNVQSVDLDLDGEDQKRTFTGSLSRFSYISMSRNQVTPSSQSKLTDFRSHSSRDPLACLAVASDASGGLVAFAGGHDDVVLAYGINSACAVASVYSHRDAVTGLDLIPRTAGTGESYLWLENSTHVMVSGSWDATVKVWSVTVSSGETVSINREPLAELFDASSSIVCVSAVSVDGEGILVAAGCADGSCCAWNLHNDGVKVVIHNEPARRGSGPCSVAKWSKEGGRINLFTGFSTGKVASFSLVDGALRKESTVSVGVAVQCLEFSEGILLVGCADGGLRLISILAGGASFDRKPTLWSAVNNAKTSPGISSISVAYVGGTLGRCVCCTGAEDGSVALFELKRVNNSLASV